MKIIIIGAGEVGYHIAKSLYLENDIVVIDEDENACQRADELDVQVITGNGANAAILEKVLIGADLLLALTGDDEINIVACMTTKLIKQSSKTFKTMARVSNPDYIDRPVAKRTQVGIDVMICPELALASEIADILSIPSAIDSESFADGKIKMMEFVVKADSHLVDKHIRDIGLFDCCIVSALFRGSQIIIPHGDDLIRAEDHIVIIGEKSAMKDISSFFGKIKKNTAMIIGGGIVGLYLAQLLETTDMKIKIIEKDRYRSEMVADHLKKTLVLLGDGTDLSLLREEGVGEMDVVISVTDSDERNLLCSLLAKQMGTKKVIVRADHFDYVPLFEMVGVDSAVSPMEATINEVLKLTMGTGIEALTTIEGDKAEIVEYTISKKSKINGKLIKNVSFPEGSIASMVINDDSTIVPRGNYKVKEEDHILVFSIPSVLPDVEKLFK
ncbi:Trk system potassium transporter TrkA [Methanohalophilus sp. RSK]|uniref:Trk system potassium transporter TrkA n=1 Tax=Methanohalophilus sp. RSK TaxID=2485783 RepID=UPI000F43C101|nr:Trk system potassium transporter TrkA [Methanohalophilus sp. RSK]RNI15690.1 Trk system potassium transporter TrkA [Methanohalophilus sp. RSK]